MFRQKNTIVIFTFMFLLLGTYAANAKVQIVINIPAFALHVYEEGVCQKTYPISIGTALNPSVLGDTTIINKVANPTYYPPNGPAKGLQPIPPGPNNPVGTRWLGLDFPGYGIHGTNNPNSIGSAASLGCIRMLNEDVEELTELVKVGTIVRIIYQTVFLQEDPVFRTKTITVFPDVYKQEVTEKQLKQELALRNWPVFEPALASLLANPQGKAEPLPLAMPLFLEDQALDLMGIKLGERSFMPWDQPFDPRVEFSDEILKWEDKYYLPLERYLALTGWKYAETQGSWSLLRPTAYLDSEPLGKAVSYQGKTYIAGGRFQRGLIPKQLEGVLLWGEIYYPAEIVANVNDPAGIRLVFPDPLQPITSE